MLPLIVGRSRLRHVLAVTHVAVSLTGLIVPALMGLQEWWPLLFGCCLFLFVPFWAWMIVDCITKEPKEGNDRLLWLLVILIANWIGALIYFFARRPARIREHGR